MFRDQLLNGVRFFMAPNDGGAGGGAGGSGSGAGAGGAGAGAGGSGAGAGGTGAAPAAFDWKANGVGDDLLPLAQAKGWKNPADALKSYSELERMVGLDKVGLPPLKDGKRDFSTWDGWNQLGRPAEAIGEKGYKITAPQGVEFGEGDKAFQQHMLPIAHKAGVTQSQLDAFIGAQHEYNTKAAEAAENKARDLAKTQTAAIHKEWGQAKGAKENLVNRFHQALGLDDDKAMPLMKALRDNGLTGAWLKLASQMGEMMAGDGTALAGSGGHDYGAMTPEMAGKEIARLKADKEFQEKFLNKSHPENQAAKDLMIRLQQAANPGAAEAV